MEFKEKLAIDFIKKQSGVNLQLIVNAGMHLYELKNNRFERAKEYTLPFSLNRLIIIYDLVNGIMQPIGVAKY